MVMGVDGWWQCCKREQGLHNGRIFVGWGVVKIAVKIVNGKRIFDSCDLWFKMMGKKMVMMMMLAPDERC